MTQLSRRALMVWLLVCLFAVLPTMAHAQEVPTFAGQFHYVGGAHEEALRKAAIDAAIEDMFFAIRPIARHRLGNATQTVQWVSFAFEGNDLHTRGMDALDVRSPVSGAEVINTWRGERTRVRQKPTAHGLIQTFVGEEGRCQNEWTLSSDGQTLTVRSTISSDRLPKPIIFTQTYRRN